MTFSIARLGPVLRSVVAAAALGVLLGAPTARAADVPTMQV